MPTSYRRWLAGSEKCTLSTRVSLGLYCVTLRTCKLQVPWRRGTCRGQGLNGGLICCVPGVQQQNFGFCLC